jgi:hypothetical protein
LDGVKKPRSSHRSALTVTYQLSERDGGTVFERQLSYPRKGPFACLFDRLFFKMHNQSTAEWALADLKSELEGNPMRAVPQFPVGPRYQPMAFASRYSLW